MTLFPIHREALADRRLAVLFERCGMAGCRTRSIARSARLPGPTAPRDQAGRRMPARADLDPAEFKTLLPSMILVDVVYDVAGKPDFIYRLLGTHEVEVRGENPVGKRVAENFFGPSLENVLGCYTSVVNSGVPSARSDSPCRWVIGKTAAEPRNRSRTRPCRSVTRRPRRHPTGSAASATSASSSCPTARTASTTRRHGPTGLTTF